MSEAPDTLPPRVEDPVLAEAMAHAEHPYRLAEQEARQQADHLAGQANEAAMAVQANPTDRISDADNDNTHNAVVPELHTTPEQLRDILANTYYGVSFYTPAQQHDGMKLPKDKGRGHHELFNERWDSTKNLQYQMGKFPGRQLAEIEDEAGRPMSEAFVEADIPEVVTCANVSEPLVLNKRNFDLRLRTYGSLVPDSPHAGEPIFMLNYATVGRSSGKYKYQDPGGRPGNTFSYRLLLPESQAKALYEAMQQHPDIARQMAAQAVDQQIGGGESAWEEISPPFEDWQTLNGGRHRMAFRTGFDQGPSQSSVVEF